MRSRIYFLGFLFLSAIFLIVILVSVKLSDFQSQLFVGKTKNKLTKIGFTKDGVEMLGELLANTGYEVKPIRLARRNEIRYHLNDNTIGVDERLTLLFWALLRKIDISYETVLDIVTNQAEDPLHSDDWDFVRARISVFYSHPRSGGFELKTFLPLAKNFTLSSLGLTEADLAKDSETISGLLKDKNLLYVLYAIGVLYLNDRYLEKNIAKTEISMGQKGISSDDGISGTWCGSYDKLLPCLSEIKDVRLRLPPPFLSPFDSFENLPRELKQTGESDYPWEKIDAYSFLIASEWKDDALRRFVQGDASELIDLINLQVAFLRLEPPTSFSFLPALEGLDVLFNGIYEILDIDSNTSESDNSKSAFGLKKQDITLQISNERKRSIKEVLQSFKELKDELRQTADISLQGRLMKRELISKDPRTLFEKLYIQARSYFIQLAMDMIGLLKG